MKTGTGLWIDHKTAIVVKINNKEEKTEQILSEVEKQLRRTGDSIMKGTFEARLVQADDSQQKALTGELNTYYDEVIALIGDAKSILKEN